MRCSKRTRDGSCLSPAIPHWFCLASQPSEETLSPNFPLISPPCGRRLPVWKYSATCFILYLPFGPKGGVLGRIGWRRLCLTAGPFFLLSIVSFT
jgi:hypothetical protein